MISTVERKKLHALRDEAASAGDVSMVETCNSALRGSMVALGKCRRALEEAEARAETREIRKRGKAPVAKSKQRAKPKRRRNDC